MYKNNEKLTVRQARALEMILAGSSIVDAAAAANVTRATVYKWLGLPGFIMAMNDAKAEAMNQLSLSLAALGRKAIKTLDDAMDDQSAGASVRIRAADIVITKLMAMRDMVEFENRLLALEEAQSNPAARDTFEVKPVNYRTAIQNLAPEGYQDKPADTIYQ